MRIVLLDVFVRSVMQYAAPVWAVNYMKGHIFDEHGHIKGLFVLYRQCIKRLLLLPGQLPTMLLIVLSNRMPLKLILQKHIFRYYKRVYDIRQLRNRPGRLRNDAYEILGECSKWAEQSEGGMYDMNNGREFVEQKGNVGQLYLQAKNEIASFMWCSPLL